MSIATPWKPKEREVWACNLQECHIDVFTNSLCAVQTQSPELANFCSAFMIFSTFDSTLNLYFLDSRSLPCRDAHFYVTSPKQGQECWA